LGEDEDGMNGGGVVRFSGMNPVDMKKIFARLGLFGGSPFGVGAGAIAMGSLSERRGVEAEARSFCRCNVFCSFKNIRSFYPEGELVDRLQD
jgi:hypothetical protein